LNHVTDRQTDLVLLPYDTTVIFVEATLWKFNMACGTPRTFPLSDLALTLQRILLRRNQYMSV